MSSVLDKLFALLKYIILTNIKCHFFRPVIYLQNSLLTPTQGKITHPIYMIKVYSIDNLSIFILNYFTQRKLIFE